MAELTGLVIAIDTDVTALEKATRQGRDAMSQFARDAEAARRVIQGTAGSYDRYNTAMQRLNELHQAGHLSTDQLRLAQDKLSKEFQDASGETRRLSEELRRAEQVTRSLETSEERLARKTAELERLHKSGAISAETYRRGLDRVNKEAKEDQMSRYFAVMSKAAPVLAAAGTAFAVTRQKMKDMHDEAERGLRSLESVREKNSRLAQIATSGTDLERMQLGADALAKRFGISREQAREMVFSARSEGFGEVSTVARASQLVGSDAATRIAGQFRSLFRGDQDLSVRQALSATLVAAAESRLDFGELARAAPVAAEAASGAGTSAEETLSLLSVLASRFKSADTAGDRIKAFSSKIAQTEGLRGLGVVGAFEALQGMSAEQREEILGGSDDLNAVYDILTKDVELIKERRAKIAADLRAAKTGGGQLGTQFLIQESDVSFLAARDAAIAKVTADIAVEQQGFSLEARRAARDKGLAARKELDSGAGFVVETYEAARAFVRGGIDAERTTASEKAFDSEDMLEHLKESARLQRMMLEVMQRSEDRAHSNDLANPQRFNQVEQVF